MYVMDLTIYYNFSICIQSVPVHLAVVSRFFIGRHGHFIHMNGSGLKNNRKDPMFQKHVGTYYGLMYIHIIHEEVPTKNQNKRN